MPEQWIGLVLERTTANTESRRILRLLVEHCNREFRSRYDPRTEDGTALHANFLHSSMVLYLLDANSGRLPPQPAMAQMFAVLSDFAVHPLPIPNPELDEIVENGSVESLLDNGRLLPNVRECLARIADTFYTNRGFRTHNFGQVTRDGIVDSLLARLQETVGDEERIANVIHY